MSPAVSHDPGRSPQLEPLAQRNSPLDWRRYLCGGGPRRVIARLAQGDPLGLRRVVAVCLRRRALLLDGDRVHLRVLARIALHARRYDGSPPFNHWLEHQVDRAVDELREQSRALELQRTGSSSSPNEAQLVRALSRPENLEGTVHETLGCPMGIDPSSSRQACAAFNHLPLRDRETFRSLVLGGAELDALAQAEGVSASHVARRARRTLEVVREAGATVDPPSPS